MNNHKIDFKFIVISALIAFSFAGFSQQDLTLDNAIIKGLENNFQIRIAKERYNIAELNNKWGTVGRFPSINLGVASINRYDNTPSFDTTTYEYERADQFTNSLAPFANMQWLLFDGLSVSINKQKLEHLEE